MNALMLELPMDALEAPGVSNQSLAAEARFMLALKLFEVGRLSSGKPGAKSLQSAAWLARVR